MTWRLHLNINDMDVRVQVVGLDRGGHLRSQGPEPTSNAGKKRWDRPSWQGSWNGSLRTTPAQVGGLDWEAILLGRSFLEGPLHPGEVEREEWSLDREDTRDAVEVAEFPLDADHHVDIFCNLKKEEEEELKQGW